MRKNLLISLIAMGVFLIMTLFLQSYSSLLLAPSSISCPDSVDVSTTGYASQYITPSNWRSNSYNTDAPRYSRGYNLALTNARIACEAEIPNIPVQITSSLANQAIAECEFVKDFTCEEGCSASTSSPECIANSPIVTPIVTSREVSEGNIIGVPKVRTVFDCKLKIEVHADGAYIATCSQTNTAENNNE